MTRNMGRELIGGQLRNADADPVFIGQGSEPPEGEAWLGIVVGYLSRDIDPAGEVRRLRSNAVLAETHLGALVPVGSRVSSKDGADAFVLVPVHQSDLIMALSAADRSRDERREQLTHGDLTAARSDVRILLAEDNRVNQVVPVKFLEQAGNTVDIANNGIKALEALKRMT